MLVAWFFLLWIQLTNTKFAFTDMLFTFHIQHNRFGHIKYKKIWVTHDYSGGESISPVKEQK